MWISTQTKYLAADILYLPACNTGKFEVAQVEARIRCTTVALTFEGLDLLSRKIMQGFISHIVSIKFK